MVKVTVLSVKVLNFEAQGGYLDQKQKPGIVHSIQNQTIQTSTVCC
jgi:hypothetical protein